MEYPFMRKYLNYKTPGGSGRWKTSQVPGTGLATCPDVGQTFDQDR